MLLMIIQVLVGTMIFTLSVVSLILMLKQRNLLLAYFLIMEILLLLLGICFTVTWGYSDYLFFFVIYAFLAIYLRLRK